MIKTFSYKVMGTYLEINIASQIAKEKIQNISDEVFFIFKKYENIFSRFNKHSELSLLNKKKDMVISDSFKELLDYCKLSYEYTNGYFNPCVSIYHKGYTQSFEQNIFSQKSKNLTNINFDEITINGNHLHLPKNTYLDFGAIAKGFTVDKASEYLQKQGFSDFVINAGGDMYISGNLGNNKRDIGLQNPFDQEKDIGNIIVTNMSISTSGNYKRKRMLGDKKFHHIINPKTNKNQRNISSITIFHTNPVFSDSLATACFNMGIDKTIEFCTKEDIGYIIVGYDKQVFFGNLEHKHIEFLYDCI